MEMDGVTNLRAAFDGITEHWSPRVVAAANGQYVKLAKVQGEFVWHRHDHEDEVFVVWRGRFTLRFRDRDEVTLGEGDLFVVPRGVEHCPYAEEETWVMLVEPAETLHTGDVVTPRTRSIAQQLGE
jgi:mannose-6-phosphate isomerase-like protein (cupin superfamily)